MRIHLMFNSSLLIVCLLTLLFFYLALVFGVTSTNGPQFKFLAESFLNGKLYLDSCPINDCKDTILLNGHYYWPLGPLPAVVLMPFVFIFNRLGIVFSQFHLNYMVLIALFALIIEISRKLGYSGEDSLYWAFAFCFASPFLAVAFFPWSWFLSHAITDLILFFLLYEFLTFRRVWVMSLFAGLTMITRITAGFGAIALVFGSVLELLKRTDHKNFPKLLFGFIPLLGFITLIFVYNYARFSNPFESGYSLQTTTNFFIKARSYGVFSLVHLPGNIYYSLFSIPLPVFRDNLSHVFKFPFIRANTWGMSVFLTSPYLIYLFSLSYKDKISKILLISSTAAALPVFLYYGIGYWQFGYRYSLDFMPFVFLLLMRGSYFKNPTLTPRIKILMITCGLFNLYLFFTMLL